MFKKNYNSVESINIFRIPNNIATVSNEKWAADSENVFDAIALREM